MYSQAWQIGNRVVASFQDAFDSNRHLDWMLEQEAACTIRDRLIITDMSFIVLKNTARRAPLAVDVSEWVAPHLPTYLEAADYYADNGDKARLFHAAKRINECLSFLVTEDVITKDEEIRNSYLIMLGDRLHLSNEEINTLKRYVNFAYIKKEQVKRTPATLE